MKILVTGGAGYIGSHVVYELINNGYEVFVLDNLSTGNKESVHPKAVLLIGDQLDANYLEQIFSAHDFEAVMHFSAKLIVPESVSEPIKYFENNTHGIALLLEAMRKHNVKNLVFSSTAAVYGNPIKSPVEEDDYKEPINPYGASKLACEWLINASTKAYGLNAVIFRYFNVAGASTTKEIGQATKGQKLTHLVPIVIETALKQNQEMFVYGNDYDTRDKTCIRDYIHVVDLARAHVLGLKYAISGKSNVFNLGSQDGVSVLEVINATEKILNTKVNYKITARRHGDPAILVASNNRAQKELGFNVSFTLEDIIKSDYEWRKNKRF